MSNPKYRTPIPDKKGQMKVIKKAIDLGQAMEKHKQEEVKKIIKNPRILKTKKWRLFWRKND